MVAAAVGIVCLYANLLADMAGIECQGASSCATYAFSISKPLISDAVCPICIFYFCLQCFADTGFAHKFDATVLCHKAIP